MEDNESQGLPAVHNLDDETLQNAPEGVEGTVEVGNLRDAPDDADEPEASVAKKGHHVPVVVEGVQQGYRFVEDD